MAQDSSVTEFVAKIVAADSSNVVSVVLYGSAADGEFHSGYSDFNLLCVLRDTSYASLARIADANDWWRKKGHRPPLVLTPEELRSTADVFSIEFIDMKQRYRVLHGEDVLASLEVPMHLHRAQLEYELREKLFLLRQHLLVASGDKELWEVMLHSLSSFTTLFRHVLIEMGERGRKHSREAVGELASRLNFDATTFLQLMDVRASRNDRKQFNATDLAQRCLAAIEKVATAVDAMQQVTRS